MNPPLPPPPLGAASRAHCLVQRLMISIRSKGSCHHIVHLCSITHAACMRHPPNETHGVATNPSTQRPSPPT